MSNSWNTIDHDLCIWMCFFHFSGYSSDSWCGAHSTRHSIASNSAQLQTPALNRCHATVPAETQRLGSLILFTSCVYCDDSCLSCIRHRKLLMRNIFVFICSLVIGIFFPFFPPLVPIAYEEEDSGFTGRRFNSKMVVYSGSKTSCLPKMMTLYEQCIRVLQNHIDCE